MLNVHPDCAHIRGLSAEQATITSQRLNDEVHEMQIHLNLPPGENNFNPIVIEDNNSKDNNEFENLIFNTQRRFISFSLHINRNVDIFNKHFIF